MAEPLQELGDHIAQATGDAVMAAYVRLGELMLDARPDKLIALITFLRDDPRCLFKQIGVVAIVEMATFLLLLLLGFVYCWKKGALEWE